jgi:hypothetical protein
MYKACKFLDTELTDYRSLRFIWREFLIFCVRTHVFWLGERFSRNLWLNAITRKTTGDLNFEVLWHAIAFSCTLSCCAHRLWNACTAEPRVRSLLLISTIGGLCWAWHTEATWQVCLCMYLFDTIVRFLPFRELHKLHSNPTGPMKADGTPDKHYKANRR